MIDKTSEIAPGFHLIALVSDKVGTLELRELSLAMNSPDGMVIVVGCSHPGIMDLDDRQSYRALLANSEDGHRHARFGDARNCCGVS